MQPKIGLPIGCSELLPVVCPYLCTCKPNDMCTHTHTHKACEEVKELLITDHDEQTTAKANKPPCFRCKIDQTCRMNPRSSLISSGCGLWDFRGNASYEQTMPMSHRKDSCLSTPMQTRSISIINANVMPSKCHPSSFCGPTQTALAREAVDHIELAQVSHIAQAVQQHHNSMHTCR